MKKLIWIATGSVVLSNLTAAPLKSAVVTTVVNDVRVSENSSAARAIGTGTKMGGSSTLLTGKKSRAEMTFTDKTVTRLGANSVFSFRSGSRDMEIKQGSFLLQVPKGAGGAKIRTATVTAGITGTTTMMEYNPGKALKFVCLEGSATLTHDNGDVIKIPAGYLLVMHPDAPGFPRPMIVDVGKMMKTSALTDKDTFGSLDATAEKSIDDTVASQDEGKQDGTLFPAHLMERGAAPRGEQDGTRSLRSEIFHSNNPNQGPTSPGGP